jgi:hypothetical protein
VGSPSGVYRIDSERRWRGYASIDWVRSYRLFGLLLLFFAVLVAFGLLRFRW